MTNVLVTGGAGYIGSHACKALACAGFVPVAYDNLCNGHDWAVRWGPLEVGDVRDGARLEEVLRRYEPCAVMHFAAFAYVGESVADPLKYYRNNVAGTVELLAAMRNRGVDKLVFSSTCATYGIPTELPISETHPQQPINPYGASKLAVERILREVDAAYGIRSIALRYFNAAGADRDGDIGERHLPETHLIPLVLEAAADPARSVTVFGSDYDTPDGTCVRDYIHVTDLAQAHVLALQGLLDGRRSDAFNLGNGKGFSVSEVIAASRRITGRPIHTQMADRRPGDPAMLVGSARKISAELGWKPQYSSLDAMIQTAWAWHSRALRW
jgi:UDP-arabinose 4-epimerase